MPAQSKQSATFDQSDCPFSPGDLVPHSGLYEICHYDEPRTTVIFTIPAVFPQCRICGNRVRYKQLRAVPHISEDSDFRESLGETNDLKAKEFSPTPPQLGTSDGLRCRRDMEAGGTG